MKPLKIICLVLALLFVLICVAGGQKRLVIKHPKMKQNDRSKVNEVNEVNEFAEDEQMEPDDELTGDDQDEANNYLLKKNSYPRKLKKKM